MDGVWRAWTAGHRVDSNSGTFHWRLKGGLSLPMTYTNWHGTEPNDRGGEEDCVQLYLNHAMWNDVRCAGKHCLICEIEL